MELTIREAAALLGKSPRTVRHLARSGRIPAKLVERRWRIDREALITAFEQQFAERRARIERLRGRIDTVLERASSTVPGEIERPGASLSEVPAFASARRAIALAEQHDSGATGSADSPRGPLPSLQSAICLIADAHHQPRPSTRLDRLERAIGAVSQALVDLLSLQDGDEAARAAGVIAHLETALLPALARQVREEARRLTPRRPGSRRGRSW